MFNDKDKIEISPDTKIYIIDKLVEPHYKDMVKSTIDGKKCWRTLGIALETSSKIMIAHYICNKRITSAKTSLILSESVLYEYYSDCRPVYKNNYRVKHPPEIQEPIPTHSQALTDNAVLPYIHYRFAAQFDSILQSE